MDTGFNYYHGADPSEYDLVLSNSEGGARRGCSSSAPGGPRPCSGRADPEFFRPLPVEKENDVFFYGYGDKFRREWMAALVGEPSRRDPRIDFALGGRDFQGDVGSARDARRRAVQRLRARDLGGAGQPQRDAPRARDRRRLVDVPAVRARRRRAPRSSRTRTRGSSAGSSRAASCSSSRTRTARSTRTARCSTIPAEAEAMGARARERVLDEHTYAHRARQVLRLLEPRGGGARMSRGRIVAIVPAFDEEAAIGARRRRRSRRSTRRSTWSSSTTARRTRPPGAAARAGATVVRLPFNLGIGAAVQTGFRYALERGYDVAVRLDGDGQHDPAELPKLLAAARARRGGRRHRLALPRGRGRATGRRSRGGSGSPGSPGSSRCSRGQRVTDTTSGSRRSTGRGSRSSRATTRATTPRSRRPCSSSSTGSGSSRCR